MTIRAEDYDYIVQLLRDRCAVTLDSEQQYLVQSRLQPVLRSHGLSDMAALVMRLRQEPYGALHTSVVEAMTIQETSFFRDAHPFDALRNVVLPDLLNRRAQDKSLLIWSAACATGQEAYSLAMLLLEYFPQLANWRVRIVATDVSRAALSKARAGRFSRLEVNRGVPSRTLSKFFERDGEEFVVREHVQDLVEWKQLNLAGSWPSMPLFDIIFLRNVLIYFSQATRTQVLRAARKFIRTDGYLFLGSTETSFGTDAAFTPTPVGRTIVYRPVAGVG